MIDTFKALVSVVERARAGGRVALDTEFVWEKTYYPRLGLVQMGLPQGECHLVDPTAIRDLSPLGELLADDSVEKVLHDAQQDLFILRRATGASSRSVFDTRLAAGFADLGASTSLLRLMHELLGVEMNKGAQRTNWLQRPLSARQKVYAEADVRHMLEARDALWQRAVDRDNGEWLRQELAGMDDPGLYDERDVREQYLRVKGAARLNGQQLAVLREVAAYREQEARRRDLPRGWLFPDVTLMALARRQPESLDDLDEIKGLSDRAIRHRGQALLDIVARAAGSPNEDWPPPMTPPGQRKVSHGELDNALALIDHRCKPRGIDPALVASRNELRSLLADGAGARAENHRALGGWRGELVGQALLRGRKG